MSGPRSGFAESFANSGPQETRQPTTPSSGHGGSLAMWEVDEENRRIEALVAFNYHVRVRPEQPLDPAEIDDLSSAIYDVLDRLVQARHR